MKAMGLVVLMMLPGCGVAYLRDTRTAGLKNCFLGLSDPITAAQARELQAETDQKDEMIAIQNAMLRELADPKTTEERKAQIRRDYEFIQTATLASQPALAWGMVRNETEQRVNVVIYQLPDKKPVAAFQLDGGQTKKLQLLAGYCYQFCFNNPVGGSWSYTNRAPIARGQPWETRFQRFL